LFSVPTVDRKSLPGGPLKEFDCFASVFQVVSAGRSHGTVTCTFAVRLVSGFSASPFVLARSWITGCVPSESESEPIVTGFHVFPLGVDGVTPPTGVYPTGSTTSSAPSVCELVASFLSVMLAVNVAPAAGVPPIVVV